MSHFNFSHAARHIILYIYSKPWEGNTVKLNTGVTVLISAWPVYCSFVWWYGSRAQWCQWALRTASLNDPVQALIGLSFYHSTAVSKLHHVCQAASHCACVFAPVTLMDWPSPYWVKYDDKGHCSSTWKILW